MPALAGQARLAVARGDLATAERDYRQRRAAAPPHRVRRGARRAVRRDRPPGARAAAVRRRHARRRGCLAANGVATDLETALFEADHGSPAAALTAARAEWTRRHSIHVADALGWALHATGRDREALRYARLANRLGTRDAPPALPPRRDRAAARARRRPRSTCGTARRLDAGVSPLARGRASARLLGGAR